MVQAFAMRLFGKKAARDSDPAAAIAAFWAWWVEAGAADAAQAVTAGTPEQLTGRLSAQVHTIDPRLAWELAPGVISEHQLVVTSEGDPETRGVARRWLLAAPAADAVWSYTDERPPADDPESVILSSDGAPSISFAEVRVGVTRDGSQLHVAVHHPAFASIPEQARAQVSFLALDTALGENAVELWLGSIDAVLDCPPDALGLLGLRSAVDALAHEYVDADGQSTWTLMQGTGPQGPMLATAQTPLHALTAPHFTSHLEVTVSYADQTAEGLPGSESLTALRELEDELSRHLGRAGKVVAHESHAGVRVIHAYAEDAGPAAAGIRQSSRPPLLESVQVKVTHDPGWEAVRHLRP